MTTPMIVLAIGSIGAGALLAIGNTLQHWLEPVVGNHETHHLIPTWITTVTALGVVAIGIAVAYRQYARRPINQVSSEWVSAPTQAARNDLYGDAINEAVFMRPGRALTKSLVDIERRGIDGAVEGLANAVSITSISMRRIQTGFARSYALSIFVGATAVVAMVVMVRLS